jgi:hypothetical protein
MAKRPPLCSKSITLETRKQYVKTFVWAVSPYGSEAWTIGETDQKIIEDLKIKWTEKVINEEVCRRIGEERTPRSTICQRRTRWVGPVKRDNNYVGSKMEGKIEGKALRGRTRDKYLGQVKKDMGKNSHR